jgi:hypothetical protein
LSPDLSGGEASEIVWRVLNVASPAVEAIESRRPIPHHLMNSA